MTVDDVISDLIELRNNGKLQGIVAVCQYTNDDGEVANLVDWSRDLDKRVTTFSLMGGMAQALHNLAESD
jgi:hypothetical protein